MADGVTALVLADRLHGAADVRQRQLPHALGKHGVDGRRHHHALRLAERFPQLVLQSEDRLHLAMRRKERVEDHVLGEHARAALHHHERVARAGDDEIELALGELRRRGIDHQLSADPSHPHARDRAVEWNVGHLERRGRADQGRHVGLVLLVEGEHGGDDLGLAAEPLGEERTQRTVDQTRVEDLLLALPSLTLEEAAWNLARGEGLLLVVAGERKEIDVLPRLFRRGRGDQHHGVAVLNEGRSAGLPRHPPHLDRKATPVKIDLDFFH